MQQENILGVIQGALALRSHRDLFEWLRKDVQAFLPHDILIAAWGDFASRQVCHDVVSSLAGMRTAEVCREEMLPLLVGMFEAWTAGGRAPFSAAFDGAAFRSASGDAGSDAVGAIARMRGAVVHGIKDERGRHDCLYVFLGGGAIIAPARVAALGLLLPQIDAAFRQVEHLPMQRSGVTGGGPEVSEGDEAAPARRKAGALLSGRECEIMRWVSVGKTNPEIGQILEISPSTVRNHLQRIFRKLDVINRAQAVFCFLISSERQQPE